MFLYLGHFKRLYKHIFWTPSHSYIWSFINSSLTMVSLGPKHNAKGEQALKTARQFYYVCFDLIFLILFHSCYRIKFPDLLDMLNKLLVSIYFLLLLFLFYFLMFQMVKLLHILIFLSYFVNKR